MPRTRRPAGSPCATGAAEVNTGQFGQVPGTVVTVLVWLEIPASALQLQRVKIVWAGPVWTYVGKVVLQLLPLSVEYCKVEPTGQVPEGAEILPPEAVPPKVVQTLLVTCTAGATDVNTGQAGQVPGTVVIKFVGLEVAGLASHVQRVKIVCVGPVWA